VDCFIANPFVCRVACVRYFVVCPISGHYE